MQTLLGRLSKTPIIIFSFLLMNLLWGPFGWVQQAIGGPLLDLLYTSEAAYQRLGELSPSQKSIHIWCSLIIDTLYPAASAAFLAGLSFRLSQTFAKPAIWARWIFILAIAIIASDLAENAMHILALTERAQALGAKDILTPLKLAAYGASTALMVAILVIAAVRRARRA